DNQKVGVSLVTDAQQALCRFPERDRNAGLQAGEHRRHLLQALPHGFPSARSLPEWAVAWRGSRGLSRHIRENQPAIEFTRERRGNTGRPASTWRAIDSAHDRSGHESSFLLHWSYSILAAAAVR